MQLLMDKWIDVKLYCYLNLENTVPAPELRRIVPISIHPSLLMLKMENII